ncbi:MAG: Lrp/AsnC family transcriptional regulator [Gemmatimonadota bacterium]
MIDAIDRAILNKLQENARTSNAEIARLVGMAPSAISERIRKLEERGIIQGYCVRLNARALQRGLVAFVSIRTERMMRDSAAILAELSSISEVQEVHLIVGDDCFMVKVRVADTEALARLLQEKIQPLDFVSATRTTIVLQTAKESLAIPLEMAEEGRLGSLREERALKA